jgi:hypothetical protein
MNNNCDNPWGKIYTITNKDFPTQVYVGSTEQKYLAKRKYRHQWEWKKGNLSYGNLFTTDNWEIKIMEMEQGLIGEPLRMREREYYDDYLAQGLDVCNQNVPWSTPEEKKAKYKKAQREWYLRKKAKQAEQ